MRRGFLSWCCPAEWRANWERAPEISRSFSISETAKAPTRFLEMSGRIDRIGEGSVALAENLGIRSDARNGGARRGILYLVFPGSGNGRPRTIEEINAEGQKLLQTWEASISPVRVHGAAARSGTGRESRRKLKHRRKMREEPVNEKALREHLVNLLSGRGAHVDWKATFSGVPPKLRGVRPERVAVLGLGIARAHADRAVGHPGIFSRCKTCLAGLAGRLLAHCASAAECEGLGQKPQIVRARPRRQ